MKYIKAKSAIKLNKNLHKKGQFWLGGYFDKLIRDAKHYDLVYEYILNNPIKANLQDAKERVYSKYDVI
jgi:REP element-mobilizing transposase RayT